MNSNYEKEFKENIYSISELNGFVKELIESVPVFNGVRVRGEISNFVHHRSGHLYFSLKDEDSVLKCVMFARDARGLAIQPTDGMKVVAKGRLTVYPPSGVYQLVVSEMSADGKGALYEAYERLKVKLAAEGLFDGERKPPIPKFPRTVGVITSPTGAAVRDIINVTGRRYPYAKIVIYPALVQGEGSENSLINGVRYFTETGKADVVIIGRGGGSIEDLWSFNSERLARAIAESNVPFISAVGHETDFTICDFVCTLRAPTPSGAAELAVPDRHAVGARFDEYLYQLKKDMLSALNTKRRELEFYSSKKVICSPYGFIDEKKLRLDMVCDKLVSLNGFKLERLRASHARLCAKLEALSPLAVLSRGYGAVFAKDGEVLTSVSQVESGDTVRVGLSDGHFTAIVEETEASKTAEKNKEKRNKDGK